MVRFTRAALIACAMITLALNPAFAGRFSPGDRPSNISGIDVSSGRAVSLEGMRGKWVLVDFFATW